MAGAAGGTISTLLLSIAQRLNPASPPFQLPEELDCICPSLRFEQGRVEVFALGLLCGLLAGPIIDLAWIIGDRWRRFVRAALWPIARVSYFVLLCVKSGRI